MAEVITTIRDDYGIIRQPITTNNPQAEAMMERPNQTLGKMRRTQNFHQKADMDIEDPVQVYRLQYDSPCELLCILQPKQHQVHLCLTGKLSITSDLRRIGLI
jgi:transposase InsO family protein